MVGWRLLKCRAKASAEITQHFIGQASLQFAVNFRCAIIHIEAILQNSDAHSDLCRVAIFDQVI